MPEQGNDHRGPGDDEDRAEQQGQPPVDVQGEARSDRCEPPRRGHADQDQVAHHAAASPQLAEAQAHPPLEQDHRHRQRDEGQERVPEQRVGIDQGVIGERPDEQAEEQEEQDRGQPQPPGEPLRSHPEQQDDGEADHGQGA